MDEATAKRLEAAVKARAERAQRDEDRLALRLIALNDLEEKYGAELGEEERGRTWQIVDIGADGFLVVKRVNAVIVKQWENTLAKLKPGQSAETGAVVNFALSGLVYPDPATFRKLVHGDEQTPGAEGIGGLAVLEIRRLHRHFEGELTGKT